ncbi:MAG: malate/lactate/ureidoglycolate dehydrogenase, partial [Betaproteobacteria bacterium]|nr:malate/lactate/ureidoglycolate dehydrogenase [Betaproteobacteria bacterium]
MSHRIDAKALKAHVSRILGMAGSSHAEAEQVADNLVMANLSGHDSHGVGMVPRYVDAVLEEGL